MIIRGMFDEKRTRATISFKDCVKRSKDSFAKECDINSIMKRYEKTGVLPQDYNGRPLYGDFSDVGDYQQCFDVVARAHTQFELLPVALRDRFGYSPAAFLDFVHDPKNAEELIKMGLATAKPNVRQNEVKDEKQNSAPSA